MTLLSRILSVSLLGIVLAGSAAAQPADLTPERFPFEPTLGYDSDVPSPAEALGYKIGTQFTLHADALDYLRTLADASDRVTMDTYGTTYEDRTLPYLVGRAVGVHRHTVGGIGQRSQVAQRVGVEGKLRADLVAERLRGRGDIAIVAQSGLKREALRREVGRLGRRRAGEQNAEEAYRKDAE